MDKIIIEDAELKEIAKKIDGTIVRKPLKEKLKIFKELFQFKYDSRYDLDSNDIVRAMLSCDNVHLADGNTIEELANWQLDRCFVFLTNVKDGMFKHLYDRDKHSLECFLYELKKWKNRFNEN